ncbi:propanediol utilization protein: diol dehydratase reactivation [Escherichia coli]|nr:propanediol utilization protein: diol dehydratase reactivation [Escherichia coli]
MESKEHTPAIVVTEIGDCISTWNEVLLGIEEEGIPFRIQHIPSGEVIDSAWQAARQSPLLVGIACDRGKADCALQKLTGISATVYADVSTR